MPKRSNKFQKLITAIHACITNEVSVEESAFLTDKETGEEREVDILLKSQIGDYSVVLSVEVNDRSRRAGSDWVEEMAGKHHALVTNKLVLVSRSGFTKPALKKAKFRGIEALAIEEAYVTDWNLALRLEGQGVFHLFNVRFSCSAHIAGNSEWLPAPLSAKLILPGGEHPSVGDIVGHVLFYPEFKHAVLEHFYSSKEQDYHAEYVPPKGTLFEKNPDKHASLVKLSIGLHLNFEATSIEFASGRFRERDIVYGQATEPDNSLCIVMMRKKNGGIEGTLYDSNGFRRLFIDPKDQVKG